ncbi:MAG: CRISPR-associated protein Cas4 [Candidatus Thermoplasmatota archaeon]|nr:CRISPR-associated protein Cas4 [Candidatus Thermoplasmatota archaeon]
MTISSVINKKISLIKHTYNFQSGKLTYNDLNSLASPLFSKSLRIAGKPDYVVKQNNKYIPVEVKTGSHFYPEKNHVYQLASYCYLIEENYKNMVTHGILVYSDTSQQFKIPFNPQLRFELESLIKEMRKILKNKNIQRNHNSANKCLNCSMKKYCHLKLNLS